MGLILVPGPLSHVRERLLVSYHAFASAKARVTEKLSGLCPVSIKVPNLASVAVQRERSENWNR